VKFKLTAYSCDAQVTSTRAVDMISCV